MCLTSSTLLRTWQVGKAAKISCQACAHTNSSQAILQIHCSMHCSMHCTNEARQQSAATRVHVMACHCNNLQHSYAAKPLLFSADKIKEVLVRHEIQAKVAMLVTDNAANMLKARCLTIQSVGFKHILEMR